MHAEPSSLVDRLPALSEHTGKQRGEEQRCAVCQFSFPLPLSASSTARVPSLFFFFESNSQLALCVCACIHLRDRMIVFFFLFRLFSCDHALDYAATPCNNCYRQKDNSSNSNHKVLCFDALKSCVIAS